MLAIIIEAVQQFYFIEIKNQPWRRDLPNENATNTTTQQTVWRFGWYFSRLSVRFDTTFAVFSQSVEILGGKVSFNFPYSKP